MKEVAIKLHFYSEDDLKDRMAEKIQTYLKTFSNISNPYLVKLLDCFNFSVNFMVFVMEYCDGGNLENAIYNQYSPLFEKDIKLFLKQINLGLSFLHERKIFHGNLKPTNILFNVGDLKISDYWFLTDILSDESLMGFEDRMYYPPECQISMEKAIDGSFDMWSVGMMCYEMIFKMRPEIGKIKVPHDASSRAKEFILKCLNEEKDKRWSSKQALESGYVAKN